MDYDPLTSNEIMGEYISALYDVSRKQGIGTINAIFA